MEETIAKKRLRRFFLGNYSEKDKSYVEEIFCDDSRKKMLESFLLSEWNKTDDHRLIQKKDLDHVLQMLKLKCKL